MRVLLCQSPKIGLGTAKITDKERIDKIEPLVDDIPPAPNIPPYIDRGNLFDLLIQMCMAMGLFWVTFCRQV